MTQHEYTEMLRKALVQIRDRASYFANHHRIEEGDYSIGVLDGFRLTTRIASEALATPPPSNKMRPMSEAPRDKEFFDLLSVFEMAKNRIPEYESSRPLARL